MKVKDMIEILDRLDPRLEVLYKDGEGVLRRVDSFTYMLAKSIFDYRGEAFCEVPEYDYQDFKDDTFQAIEITQKV